VNLFGGEHTGETSVCSPRNRFTASQAPYEHRPQRIGEKDAVYRTPGRNAFDESFDRDLGSMPCCSCVVRG